MLADYPDVFAGGAIDSGPMRHQPHRHHQLRGRRGADDVFSVTGSVVSAID
jgi:hypothetical protein